MTAHRDDFATCPICRTALDPDPDERKLTCRTCQGSLVIEPEVLRVLGDILYDPPTELPLGEPQGTERVRTCPRCQTQMVKHLLYTIRVDRCEAHGIWFDQDEMQRVLAEALEGNREPMPLREKVFAGAMFGGLIAANLIRFIFFMPK